MAAIGCGKCGWGRIVKGNTVTRCSNCGDGEFVMADKTTESVELALAELREMFPDAPWITISGDYVNRLDGLGRNSTRISICGGGFFTAPTLYEAMSQIRGRSEQFRSRITLESGGQIKMTNTYFNLEQGDRVELKTEFDRGRFQAGHRGTVQRVSDWLGKNKVKVSVLFDGDNAPYEFSPQTGGVLRRLISLSDPLDSFIEELLDIARENPIDDARIIIRDRLVKDAARTVAGRETST